MVNRIALDTNTVIAFLNGDEEISKVLSSFDKLYLPVTVCGELMFGAINSRLAEKNVSRYRELINSCEILNIERLVADQYAMVRLDLKMKGKPIPENDIWIAAACLTNDIPLFTFDKHFQHVKDLKVLSQIEK
jgi:tRNA(fMet)-specific endonuclease VapC